MGHFLSRAQWAPCVSRTGPRPAALGSVYYRVLVTGEPVGRPFTDRLVDGYLRGLAR
jgi:hypothetical protein